MSDLDEVIAALESAEASASLGRAQAGRSGRAQARRPRARRPRQADSGDEEEPAEAGVGDLTDDFMEDLLNGNARPGPEEEEEEEEEEEDDLDEFGEDDNDGAAHEARPQACTARRAYHRQAGAGRCDGAASTPATTAAV